MLEAKMTFRTKVLIISLVLLCTIPAGLSLAADSTYQTITSEQLKALIDEKKAFTLIDARTEEEYQEAHIITAINIPEKSFESLTSLLPADKNAQLVFYCNGVKCGKSKRTAKKAEALGYTNIVIYNEGFPVWEEKNLPIVAGAEYGRKIETTKLKPADMKALIDENKNDYVLVDVRDASEYKEGRIPGAINIPAERFASAQDILPKEKKIIVYCNTGSRSYMAYRKLIKMDYKQIYQTLFAEWKEAGFEELKK
ncbi:MAG: rhodanese-like domain-containing protein [Nitrospirota bacterium]